MTTKEEAREKIKHLVEEFSEIHKSYLDSMPEADIKHQFIELLFEEVLGWDIKNVKRQRINRRI